MMHGAGGQWAHGDMETPLLWSPPACHRYQVSGQNVAGAELAEMNIRLATEAHGPEV